MTSFKVTKKAFDDLLHIGKYTHNRWSATHRNLYLKQLDDCFQKLAENPNMGINSDYIKEGYYKFPQGSHLIFYKSTSKRSITIVRVLHKSMDFESRF